MTQEKLRQIIDCSKNLKLTLSIVFIENGVQQKQRINFNNISYAWFCNDEDLILYDEIIKRWITINIAKIVSVNINEKIIF